MKPGDTCDITISVELGQDIEMSLELLSAVASEAATKLELEFGFKVLMTRVNTMSSEIAP